MKFERLNAYILYFGALFTFSAHLYVDLLPIWGKIIVYVLSGLWIIDLIVIFPLQVSYERRHNPPEKEEVPRFIEWPVRILAIIVIIGSILGIGVCIVACLI